MLQANPNLKKIIILAGIDKKISFHCIRHTFATRALNKGISLESDDSSELLDHDYFYKNYFADY